MGDYIEGVNDSPPSIVDQLAEIATPPDEVRRRMTLAADSALAWCRSAWPDLPRARSYTRERIREVYLGKRFSGFNPQQTTEKLIGARMKLYKKDLAAHRRQVKIERKRDERDRSKGRLTGSWWGSRRDRVKQKKRR